MGLDLLIKFAHFCRAVVLHATVRLVPVLQQLCSGLKIYNLLGMVRAEKDICRQLFVQELCRKVRNTFSFSRIQH